MHAADEVAGVALRARAFAPQVYSAPEWNAQLPKAIEAFFVTKDKWTGRYPDVQATEAHRKFLQAYGLTKKQVPLLLLDPANWEEPFSVPAEDTWG